MLNVTPQQRREIDRQVGALLARTRSFNALDPATRAQVQRDTTAIVEGLAAPTDPYARALGPGDESRAQRYRDIANLPGGAGERSQSVIRDGQFGRGVDVGVTQAARMVREINFPQFVASLIAGTFDAIVQSSIEQMKAYAEMVRSVATSLNDFRDKNVSENQGRDHLIGRYPQLFQLGMGEDGPRVQMREGADDGSLPDFASELGLGESITSLDEEVIEQKLVPAARTDLARSRQQLMATLVLMGINRIVVTDGKINAKVRFQFSASDRQKTNAASYDYQNYGQKVEQKVTRNREVNEDRGQGTAEYKDGVYNSRWTGGNRYATEEYNRETTSTPEIRLTSETHTDTQASLTASGQLMGEVSINFRSDVFPLEKLVNTDQLLMLNQAQRTEVSAARPRGVQAPAAQPAAPAAPPATAPATQPAQPQR